MTSNQGWHLRMARSVSKAHYFIGGRSLCGRQTVSAEARLDDSMHHSAHNCETCMKGREKLSLRGAEHE